MFTYVREFSHIVVCSVVLTVTSNEKPSSLPLFAGNTLSALTPGLTTAQAMAQKVT